MTSALGKPRNSVVYNRRKKRIFPYVFIAPFFLGVLLFQLYPAVSSIVLGFFKWNGMGKMKPIGFFNFVNLFKDHYFLQSLGNTALFAIIAGPITILLGVIIAFMMNNLAMRSAPFFRTVMFLPNITTPIAVGILFTYLFDWQYGVVNIISHALGIMPEMVNWTGEPGLTWVLISSIVVWRWFGYHMVIELAAMQSIPNELFEAATIDGASKPKLLWHITIPQIKPTIIFLTVTSIIGGLNLFDEPMIIYGAKVGSGGPGNSASTLALYVYNTVFGNGRWGYGAAASFIVFLIGLACSLTFYLMTRPKES